MPAKGAAAARAARGQGHQAAAAGNKKRKAPDVLDSARKAAAADLKAGPSTARPERSMGGLKASFEQQVQGLQWASLLQLASPLPVGKVATAACP